MTLKEKEEKQKKKTKIPKTVLLQETDTDQIWKATTKERNRMHASSWVSIILV